MSVRVTNTPSGNPIKPVYAEQVLLTASTLDTGFGGPVHPAATKAGAQEASNMLHVCCPRQALQPPSTVLLCLKSCMPHTRTCRYPHPPTPLHLSSIPSRNPLLLPLLPTNTTTAAAVGTAAAAIAAATAAHHHHCCCCCSHRRRHCCCCRRNQNGLAPSTATKPQHTALPTTSQSPWGSGWHPRQAHPPGSPLLL